MGCTLADAKLTKLLLQAKNSSEFIGLVLVYLKEQKGISLMKLSQRAGFAAKSFLRDVSLGKKRLSPQSAPMVASAFRLETDDTRYFCAMVEMENASPKAGGPVLKRSFKLLRERLETKLNEPAIDLKSIEGQQWFRIYAALGDKEDGATLAQISKRAGLPELTCENILSLLCKAKAVEKTNLNYRPSHNHLVFKDKEIFRTQYLMLLNELYQRSSTKFDDPHSLFFQGWFSVSESSLPEFKKKLREVMSQFVDENEEPDGNVVVAIGLGAVNVSKR